MSSVSTLRPVAERNWLSGFGNLLNKESSLWWGTRRWWIQSLLWLVVSNGLLALILWLPDEGAPAPDVAAVFIMIHGVFATFGVMVLAQSAIVGEKQSGTAAWIMSNPVSRSAFVLAKLISNALWILVILVGLQALVAYGQLSLRLHALLPPGPFVAGLALMTLHMLFYLTLSLMLGAFFNGRGPVIGISIGLLIGQNIVGQILVGAVPWLPAVLPQSVLDLAGAVSQGQSLPDFWPIPILVTAALSVAFVLLAILRFQREEF